MKKVLCLVLTCMLVLSAFGTIAFASEDEIIIKTGTEFKNFVKSTNFGKTFIIEGTETLADGSTGIVLLSDQSSVSGFYGTLRGVEGKNNIQISKPLITSVGGENTGDVAIDNIILKGANEDGTGAVSYADHAGALICSAATNYPFTVTISNVTNNLDVSTTKANSYVGGLIGFIRYRTVDFINCVNNRNVVANGTNSVGGFVGGVRETENVTFNGCINYGDVSTATNTKAGGILGSQYGSVLATITNCANYGNITSTATTANTTGAGGISGSTARVSNCFNAGTITSATMAGGILGTALNESLEITNCFNVGSVTSTSATNSPAGIVGSYSATGCIVTNSYNLGTITGTNPKQIIDNKTTKVDELCVNNYCTNAKDTNDSMVGTQVTLNDLAKGLPEGFSTDVWTYTKDAEYNYSLPQLKDNLFTNDVNDAWFFEVQEEITEVTVTTTPLAFTGTTDPDFVPTTETGEEITGGYSVVAARFVLPTGVTVADVEFGMLISKTVSGEDLTAETCTKKAIASKNYNCAFGILFYGNMVDGDTYYVRPYVKYNDAYTYGDGTSFVFDAE